MNSTDESEVEMLNNHINNPITDHDNNTGQASPVVASSKGMRPLHPIDQFRIGNVQTKNSKATTNIIYVQLIRA